MSSFELGAAMERDQLRQELTAARDDSEKYAREWSAEHTRALVAETERDRLRGLLRMALPHVRGAGDDTLETIIRAALAKEGK